MSERLSQLKNICDIIFHITNFEIELFDSNFNQLLYLSRNEYPFAISAYSQEYCKIMKENLGHFDHSACHFHYSPEFSLISLDIRIQLSENEVYYACVGPILTEVYNDMFILKVMQNQKPSVTLKDSFSNFYEHLSIYTNKTKKMLLVTYYLLTTSPDLSSIDLQLDNSDVLSPEILANAPISGYTSISKNDLLFNYEQELIWRAAVTRGDSKTAKHACSEMKKDEFLYRAPSHSYPALQKLLFSINAICRTAALDGSAFPLNVHVVYETFLVRIENTTNTIAAEELINEMFDTYCDLVISSQTIGYSPIVTKAIKYLYSHYEQPLTLSKVAVEIHCSEGHLSRTFHKETHKTLSEYINSLRIEQAISMLESTQNSITDIALTVGFSSYTKFSIEFKKHTGKSASEYLNGKIN